jgi:hypothetical protein
MNISGSLVILLFAVIAVTIFAVLSVRAAWHEYKLAQKADESIKAYYTADTKAGFMINAMNANAEEIMDSEGTLNTDTLCESLSDEALNDDATLENTKDTITCSIGVDYNRTIQAVLDADNETGRLTVLSYRTLINDEGTYTININ